MNNQLKNDHYVYVLKDKHGVIRYVGEGRGDRLNDKSGRIPLFHQLMQDGGVTYKIKEGLTKAEATDVENMFLDLYLNNPDDHINLINVFGRREIRTLVYDELKDYFKLSAESESGISRIKHSYHPKRSLDGDNGYKSKKGYWQISFKGEPRVAHRLVWVLYNKQDLDGDFVINHIDGDPSNNDPLNLEKVTLLENCHKKVNYKPSKTGHIGILLKKDRHGEYITVSAFCPHPTKKGTAKSFSANKYGYDEAVRLAIEWREAKLKELYPQIYNKENPSEL